MQRRQLFEQPAEASTPEAVAPVQRRPGPRGAAELAADDKTHRAGQPFHIKYRPENFAEVVGQKEVVRSIEDVLHAPTVPHAFLLLGPSGTGKTTLARIIAKHLGVLSNNIMEVDAATNSGVDDMRSIMETLRYQGFGSNPRKMVILDGVHAASKAAWQSVLKVLEEPPPHVYFALCTTEAGKVPETVVTRCHTYTLKSVRTDDIGDLLDVVAMKEGLKTPREIVNMVSYAAGGSPRKALVMLSMVRNVTDPKEAERILETPLEDAETIELCRKLVNKQLDWNWVQGFFQRHVDQNPESIRINVVNYFNKVLLTAKPNEVPRLLDILYLFSKPMNPADKMAPLFLALGDLLFPRQ